MTQLIITAMFILVFLVVMTTYKITKSYLIYYGIAGTSDRKYNTIVINFKVPLHHESSTIATRRLLKQIMDQHNESIEGVENHIKDIQSIIIKSSTRVN